MTIKRWKWMFGKTIRSVVFVYLTITLFSVAVGGEWKTVWTASAQGPYPSGYPIAQPDLSLALPDAAAGASDQSLRMIVRPCIWGERVRIRFTNAFGAVPMTITDAFAGIHAGGATVVNGTNTPILFNNGARTTSIEPGAHIWSDPVPLGFATGAPDGLLAGRKLAVSFHILGKSGPMTWHAVANGTSYLSRPDSDSVAGSVDEKGFPFGTSSWFFIDAVDMWTDSATRVAVCLGDSVTDGLMSTMNGDDSWPDCLSRIAAGRKRGGVSIVNAGITGNTLYAPPGFVYSAHSPLGNGPSMLERFDRDVLSLSGVTAIVILAGINDIAMGGRSVDEVAAGFRRLVARAKEVNPAIRVIGATLTPSLGASAPEYGNEQIDIKRRRLNDIIRADGIFDAVVDFEKALLDVETGQMRREFAPDNVFGGSGDYLHPNRVGYLRMAEAFPLELLVR